MKRQSTQEEHSIDELSLDQLVKSIAHYQRKAAEIGLKPTKQEKDLLPVYRNLYESRRALLEAVKEGHPELWTDFLDHDHPDTHVGDRSADRLTEAELMDEINRYEGKATKLAEAGGIHEHNLRLAYELMARHRSHQLESLRQERDAERLGPTSV